MIDDHLKPLIGHPKSFPHRQVQAFCRPEQSVRERAIWLAQLARRYEASSWPRDQAAGAMPPHYRGTEREYLYRAFSACPVPTSERQLQAILARPQEPVDMKSNT